MKDKKKLLFLSDSPLTCTGYGTIATQIANRMAKHGWEVHYMGHNYLGQDLPPGLKFKDGTELNFTLYGTGMEPYCKDLLLPRIAEIKPEVYITLLDTFMMFPFYLQMDCRIPPRPNRSPEYCWCRVTLCRCAAAGALLALAKFNLSLTSLLG